MLIPLLHPARETVSVASAESGVTVPVASTALTSPRGLNSNVKIVPAIVAPSGKRTNGPSSEGVDLNVSIGPGDGNATSSQRLVALSVVGTPVSSTRRSWPATGQFSRTRI